MCLTRFAVSEELDLAEGGEVNPHRDVRPHLERQKFEDLVLVEALLGRPRVRHPQIDSILIKSVIILTRLID